MKNRKNNNQRKTLQPLVITINLLILLILGNAMGLDHFSGKAVDAPATASGVQNQPVSGTSSTVDLVTANQCVIKLTEFGDPEFEKYKIFMEDNFKNKSSTSSLLNLGIQRYDKFKADIRNQYEVLVGQQLELAAKSGASNSVQILGLAKCEAKVREYSENAAQMLKMRAITTSGAKKASIFVEKYKQINSKLKALDLDIMKMVVNISTFEQKLPCYLKSCV